MGLSSAPTLPYLSTRKPGRYAFKLLFSTWNGSLYKLVWRNLVTWLILYYAIYFWYHFGMQPHQQTIFESISRHLEKHNSYLPLTFVLGFYVTTVIGRWWVHWDSLPWPDAEGFWLASIVRGQDEKSRMLRRSVMRFLNMTACYTQCLLSPRVRKRFPTLEHFVEAGLMTENERRIFERVSNGQKLYYLPVIWAGMTVSKAKDEKILDKYEWKSCMDALNEFRARCSRSLLIEIQNVPIVYSQIVSLATYAYSAVCLVSRQFVPPGDKDKHAEDDITDFYFPLMTVLQLVFYWGWLKVAESMIDPYGDDDADFPMNALIDRNLQVSYNMVDRITGADDHPELVKDAYWDVVVPAELPHTAESRALENPLRHSDVYPLDHAGVDGILDDLPTSKSSMFEMERRAMAMRHKRRSTLRRVIGSLRHRSTAVERANGVLKQEELGSKGGAFGVLHAHQGDKAKGRYQKSASASRQQLFPIVEGGITLGEQISSESSTGQDEPNGEKVKSKTNAAGTVCESPSVKRWSTFNHGPASVSARKSKQGNGLAQVDGQGQGGHDDKDNFQNAFLDKKMHSSSGVASAHPFDKARLLTSSVTEVDKGGEEGCVLGSEPSLITCWVQDRSITESAKTGGNGSSMKQDHGPMESSFSFSKDDDDNMDGFSKTWSSSGLKDKADHDRDRDNV